MELPLANAAKSRVRHAGDSDTTRGGSRLFLRGGSAPISDDDDDDDEQEEEEPYLFTEISGKQKHKEYNKSSIHLFLRPEWSSSWRFKFKN